MIQILFNVCCMFGPLSPNFCNVCVSLEVNKVNALTVSVLSFIANGSRCAAAFFKFLRTVTLKGQATNVC